MEPNSLITHDEAVRRYALDLVATGYQVNARVAGWFDEPDFVNGYKPDIIATKNNQIIIIEIKKGAMDWPKISALEQFVKDHHSFEIRVFAPDEILSASGRHPVHGSE